MSMTRHRDFTSGYGVAVLSPNAPGRSRYGAIRGVMTTRPGAIAVGLLLAQLLPTTGVTRYDRPSVESLHGQPLAVRAALAQQ
jgi:hypothetical protein